MKNIKERKNILKFLEWFWKFYFVRNTLEKVFAYFIHERENVNKWLDQKQVAEGN